MRYNLHHPITPTGSAKSCMLYLQVALYEIFSFGNTPYPLVQQCDMLSYLKSGARLEKSELCPDEMFVISTACSQSSHMPFRYALMKECWCVDLVERPGIEHIRQRLGHLLELFSEVYGYLSVHSDDYLVVSSVRGALNSKTAHEFTQ